MVIIERLFGLAKMAKDFQTSAPSRDEYDDVEGEDELYKFIKLVMEGFWMMEELNSMDRFITQTEMKEHNKNEYVIEDEIMLMVGEIVIFFFSIFVP